MGSKTYRLNENIVDVARAALIDQTRPRWKPVITDEHGNQVEGPATSHTGHSSASVSRFADPAFVADYGPALARVSDADIIHAALQLVIDYASQQPDGKTGMPFFDEEGLA